jgi:hypothetical protein
MSIITIEQLKTKFESGDWPRSTDYMDMIDTLAALPEVGGANLIRNGSGIPSNSIGIDGDFYINIVNYDIYGPKSSGVWGNATSLIGPTGATGSTGTQGATGATGNTGPAGPGVPSGGTTSQYLTKVDGTNYNTQWSTLDLSGKQDVVTDVSSTEIGYLNGVTSGIQTQLNDKAPLNSPTFTGTVTSSNNLIVDGDFTVNGTNFNASATSITIEDNMLQLAHQNAVNTVDLGLVVGYNDGTAKHSGLVRDVSDSKWKLFDGVTTEPTTTVNFGQGSLDALAVGAFEATSATIGDVSNTELQHLNGVTSGIQTQLDAKTSYSSPTIGSTSIASGATVTTIAGLTLTSPTISTITNTGTVTLPTSTDTLVGRATTDTLTNKTLTDPKINLAFDAETASYTAVLANNGQIVTMNNASANTFSIPTNASVAYPIGTQINVLQIGEGQTTIQAVTSGTTTILSTADASAAPKLRERYSMATCIKASTDLWYVVGDIS